MLTRRLLLIKMKRCYFTFFVALSLSSIIYLLPKNKSASPALEDTIASRLPNYYVHIFYDGRFQNAKIDGEYKHWNYKNIQVEENTNSAFYPSLGLYSSNDPNIIDVHMRQIRDAGIGVVVVLWWPEHFEDSPPMSLLFKYADKYNLKVTIQVQNYLDRDIVNLRKNLNYFFEKYGQHPAFYRTKTARNTVLPLIYIYDSYLIPVRRWNMFLGNASNMTVRGTNLDAIYIGLLVKEEQRYLLMNSDFDGFYTYFAIYNLTYGSNWYQWPYIQDFARERDAIFIPTVSPGFNDKSAMEYSMNRKHGAYYSNSWMRAVVCRSKFVSINSFNGWIEGTQIEPAEPKAVVGRNFKYTYEDYEPEGPDHYLTLTKPWVIEFVNRSLLRTF